MRPNLTQLGEACEFIKDGTHGSPERTALGVPVLSAEHVQDGRLSFSTGRFTSQLELDVFQKRLLPRPGDVLLTIVGTIGRTAILREARPFVFQRSVCVLRPRAGILDSDYLRYAFSSDFVVRQLEKETKQVAQAGIYLDSINGIELPLPDLSKQQRIARLLDRADRLRRTRRYALELSETFLPAAFLELFGDPIKNPAGFRTQQLEDLIDPNRPISYGILMPGSDIPGGVPYIRVTDIQDGRIIVANIRRTTPKIDQAYKRSKLKGGDLLMTIRGHVGRMAIVPPSLEGANTTQDTARLAPRNSVNAQYLMGCLGADGMQRWMADLTRGAAVQGINLGDVKELPIPVPPMSLQKRWVSLVSCANHLRSAQREAFRQADHLFQSLLHRAFSENG